MTSVSSKKAAFFRRLRKHLSARADSGRMRGLLSHKLIGHHGQHDSRKDFENANCYRVSKRACVYTRETIIRARDAHSINIYKCARFINICNV